MLISVYTIHLYLYTPQCTLHIYNGLYGRVNIGLFCHTPGVAVARSVNRKTAMMMLLTGLPVNAKGFVTFYLFLTLHKYLSILY